MTAAVSPDAGELRSYPQHPPERFRDVLLEMGCPPWQSRRRSHVPTAWHHVVLFAVRTGMLDRPMGEFDECVSELCWYMKKQLGIPYIPASIRKAYEWLRKAKIGEIRVLTDVGKVRPRAHIEREFALLGIKPERKKTRWHTDWSYQMRRLAKQGRRRQVLSNDDW